MSPWRRGLVVAAIQLAIVSSLGAKLLYDRATRPRVWAETAPYDPELPIRGRYVSLNVVVDTVGIAREAEPQGWARTPVRLAVEGDRLVAHPAAEGVSADHEIVFLPRAGESVAVLADRVAFFIPEHVEDPSRRADGETLWVEVTLPKQGPPRPIRLGVRKDGVLTPLTLR
jgi:hypothetical protein